jgi:hypothetical protein
MRTLLIAVAVIGIWTGAVTALANRALRFHALSVYHMQLFHRHSKFAVPVSMAARIDSVTGAPLPDTLKAEYHLCLASKYYRASLLWFLPVAPDPPEPK